MPSSVFTFQQSEQPIMGSYGVRVLYIWKHAEGADVEIVEVIQAPAPIEMLIEVDINQVYAGHFRGTFTELEMERLLLAFAADYGLDVVAIHKVYSLEEGHLPLYNLCLYSISEESYRMLQPRMFPGRIAVPRGNVRRTLLCEATLMEMMQHSLTELRDILRRECNSVCTADGSMMVGGGIHAVKYEQITKFYALFEIQEGVGHGYY